MFSRTYIFKANMGCACSQVKSKVTLQFPDNTPEEVIANEVKKSYSDWLSKQLDWNYYEIDSEDKPVTGWSCVEVICIR